MSGGAGVPPVPVLDPERAGNAASATRPQADTAQTLRDPEESANNTFSQIL